MILSESQIESCNGEHINRHRIQLSGLLQELSHRGIDSEVLIQKISDFSVAIPSWALGTGGTRFGRFAGGGEPRNLEEKLMDAALLHQLSGAAGSISLHIPWDIPQNPAALRALASELQIDFDAVNSNTFQDQAGQAHSYKFGSLSHSNADVRKAAVAHNIEVIQHGEMLGSKALTVWLADGSDFPGQQNFRKARQRTLQSLQSIYEALPQDWQLLVEYKPYEPHFYSMVIPDWGTSLLMCQALGHRANVLVDLGHHLPNTNIEQIVAGLLAQNRLGGFHFNGSMYGDDDLTVGSIKPYQLFLIFAELTDGEGCLPDYFSKLAWMIDASHNIKDPLEDLLQSLQNIKVAYTKALLIDRNALEIAQDNNDATAAEEIIREAFDTDVRPLIAEAALRKGNAMQTVAAYRTLKIRQQLINERGMHTHATGL